MDIQETTNAVNAKNAKVLSSPAYRGTETKLRRFLKHYAKNGRVLAACEAAGIDHTLHYRRMQSDPIYREAVEEAEQQVAQKVEDRVYDMAMENELQAALALLRRFRPNQYRDRTSIDLTATVTPADMLAEARSRVITLPPSDERNGTEG